MNIKRRMAFFILISLFSFLPGCSYTSQPSDPNRQVILTVNGDKITVGEIKREMALRAKQDPSFKATRAALAQQLEIIVNRRLLIQEAARRRLAEQETFVETIRNFWEQTLVRNLFNQMSDELAKSMTVSENEINAYYSKLSQKVTFEMSRSAQKKTLDELAEKLRRGKIVPLNETIGPVEYGDIASPGLEEAFSLGIGESKIYFENGLYYLVRIAAKIQVQPPALQDVREKIEDRIKQRKQQAALEKWLKDQRAKARIQMFATKTAVTEKR